MFDICMRYTAFQSFQRGDYKKFESTSKSRFFKCNQKTRYENIIGEITGFRNHSSQYTEDTIIRASNIAIDVAKTHFKCDEFSNFWKLVPIEYQQAWIKYCKTVTLPEDYF